MESMKQCPQCGKYMAADRTYCMNCGVTLGIRCPDCRTVLPVGAKTCTACGHSFVVKKKRLSIPAWGWMKQHANPLLLLAVCLLLIATLVLAALPASSLLASFGDDILLDFSASGYNLMQYFLGIGGKPAAVTELLGLRVLKDLTAPLQALLLLQGLGWLILLAGTVCALILLGGNYRRLGLPTARRLFMPLGVALGGAALVFGPTPAVRHIITDALSGSTAVDADTVLTVSSAPLWPLFLLILTAVVMVLYLLLTLGVFRRRESEGEERSLGRLLAIPVNGFLCLCRRVARCLRRTKNKGGKVDSTRDEPAFAVTPRFSSYLILFVVSLVFTQALLSKISHIFFWFVFILPWLLLIYVLLSRHALTVGMLSDNATTEKNAPYTYEFRIDNRSPLALPFIEALVSIPQSNSVRCTERFVRLSLAPFTGYCMKNTVRFRYRGTYEIGVKSFYIYDFFRLFRVRVDVENLTTVYVLPRRLTLDDTLAQAISDSTVRTVRSPLVVDKLEVSDIRDYQNGDPLKSIHWKLSSKSENFIVKDYNTGTSNQTVVFCDLEPHFPDTAPTHGETEATAEKSRRARRSERKKADRAAADRRAKKKRVKENDDTHAISDEELQRRLDDRAAAAEVLAGKNGMADTVVPPPSLAAEEFVDVHELAMPLYYDDMNEYLADGVVELTIASVLSELRQGHEVLLLWFDRRSDSGVFAYPLRGIDEFENIYRLFATAPLCTAEEAVRPGLGDRSGRRAGRDSAREKAKSTVSVTALAAMVSDIQSVKQMFVISELNAAMLTDLCALPGVSDAGSFGSAEVVLYDPPDRYKYPRERAAYLEGCREQLAACGLSLTAGAFNITAPADSTTATKGGECREA